MPRRVRENIGEGEAPAAYTLKSLPTDERPRERLLQAGSGALSDGELLAIVLRTGLPGEMVTELANSLLTEHRGFWGLSEASIERLSQRKGLKGAKIAQIKAAIEIGKRMAQRRDPDIRPRIGSPEEAAQLVEFEMAGLPQEEMWIVLLDTKNNVIGRPRMVYRGSLNSTSFRNGDLFREAVRENAASVVVAHNHPSGDPTPSPEDVQVTRQIVEAGRLLDVQVLDHLVIGRGGNPGWVSMRQRHLGFA